MKKSNDQTLSQVLNLVLDEYKLKPQLHETRIKALWEQLMGKTISTYTQQISLRKGTLYLSIMSAPLRQELSFGKDKIKKMLNEELGEDVVVDVVIR